MWYPRRFSDRSWKFFCSGSAIHLQWSWLILPFAFFYRFSLCVLEVWLASCSGVRYNKYFVPSRKVILNRMDPSWNRFYPLWWPMLEPVSLNRGSLFRSLLQSWRSIMVLLQGGWRNNLPKSNVRNGNPIRRGRKEPKMSQISETYGKGGSLCMERLSHPPDPLWNHGGQQDPEKYCTTSPDLCRQPAKRNLRRTTHALPGGYSQPKSPTTYCRYIIVHVLLERETLPWLCGRLTARYEQGIPNRAYPIPEGKELFGTTSFPLHI